MVYTSDYYTTRSYSRPVTSSYTVSTPRVYLTSERPGQHQTRNHEYSYSSTVESRTNSNDPYVGNRSQSSSYTTERNSRSGPGGYNYTTERSSTSGAGPGGYSYSSTSSGRLPGGNTYRHYSYRV